MPGVRADSFDDPDTDRQTVTTMLWLLSLAVKALALPAAVLAFYLIFNEFVRYTNRLSGIKGPRGLPLIGNLREVTPILPSLSLSSLLLTPSHR
jgi:hypothetical protein